jgi:hypothetical protein
MRRRPRRADAASSDGQRNGNGMFKSLGNIRVNPSVGLLFIAMTEKPQRLRVNGQAMVVGMTRCCAN